MDTMKVASQLIGFLGDNQELISQFVAHPYSTTAKATGTTDEISKSDMSQILTQVAAQVAGQELGGSETVSAASALMGQSGGSVHELASMLFGGAGATASGATVSAASATATSDAAKKSAASTDSSKKLDSSQMMADILTKSVAGAVSSRAFAGILKGALGLGQQQAQQQKK